MYAKHFNFRELPFSITPNPRYVYLSPKHREALAHLLYGISAGGGFVALTGEVGTGKTTLCRCLLEQLPEDVDIALIFNPRLNSRELLASICDELRIPHPQHRASLKLLIDLLNRHLLDAHARGRRTVVLIDEAQNLNYDVLEQIRLLTNLETNEAKLLQIILVGQPELNALLRRQNLRQLSQRVTARYHLRPLSFAETAAYIRHRLAVSGGSEQIFTTTAVAKIYRLSTGIPRLINLICDRALLGAYTQNKTKVGYWIVRKAAREVLPAVERGRLSLRPSGALALIAMTLIAGAVSFALMPGVGSAFIAQKLDVAVEKVRMVMASHREDLPQRATTMTQSNPDQGDKLEVTRSDPAPAEKSALTLMSRSQPDRTDSGSVAGESAPESPKVGVRPTEETPPRDTSALPSPGPAVTPATQPGATLAQVIAEPNWSRRAALAQLLALWQVNQPPENVDECLIVKQSGLRCLFQKGSWSQLLSLNHPAILELILPDGEKRYATLVRVDQGQAVLSLGDQHHSFDVTDILPFWRGDAILLWKPRNNRAASIKPGDTGEAVVWLRHQLGVQTPAAQANYFDERLKARVVAFQQAHDVLPDGMVGPLTMIHLTQGSNDPALPRLGSKLD